MDFLLPQRQMYDMVCWMDDDSTSATSLVTACAATGRCSVFSMYLTLTYMFSMKDGLIYTSYFVKWYFQVCLKHSFQRYHQRSFRLSTENNVERHL